MNGWVFGYKLSGCGFKSPSNHLNFRYRACFEQGVLDIKTTVECGFTLKCIHDMIRTSSQSWSEILSWNQYCFEEGVVFVGFCCNFSGCHVIYVTCSRISFFQQYFRKQICYNQKLIWVISLKWMDKGEFYNILM